VHGKRGKIGRHGDSQRSHGFPFHLKKSQHLKIGSIKITDFFLFRKMKTSTSRHVSFSSSSRDATDAPPSRLRRLTRAL
jgi:hypothetical protein